MKIRGVKIGHSEHSDVTFQQVSILVLPVKDFEFCGYTPTRGVFNPRVRYAVADIVAVVADTKGTWVEFQIDHGANDNGRRYGWTRLSAVEVLHLVQIADDPFALSRVANNVGGAVDEMQDQERRRVQGD